MRRYIRWLFAAGIGCAAVGVAFWGCASNRPTTVATTRPASRPADLANTATLTVKVTDVRNRKGQLIFGVFSSAAGFPSDATQSVDWQITPLGADQVTFTVQIPPGVYSASILHDENSNNKMDTRFGIPSEGYGVTNNPKPRFRAARFDEATFTLPSEGATLTISLQYF